MANQSVSRRHFFYGALLAGAVPTAGYGSTPSLKFMGYKSPNEKLNIASVGAGGKAASDIQGCSTENIVAMADPDDKRAERMFKLHEKAPKFKDFRRMFDQESKNIDAVIVAIPDFMHATAATWAMERGKHVYVQKPLTRTIWEARMLTEAAQKYKVATQMGNQGYSGEGTRQCAEIIWSGEIGDVKEVHAWTNRPIWPQGLTEIPAEAAVPDTLDWNTWLGIQSMRPYSPAYLPGKWRGFFDFVCGALGDMACHILGAPNMALMLGAPTSAECVSQEGTSTFSFPKKSVIRFDFPKRGTMPAVSLYWHDGMTGPPAYPKGLAETEKLGDVLYEGRQPNPKDPPPDSNGSLFIGEKGFVTTGTYGQNTRLLPADRMKDYKMPPQLLTRSPGHYRDWIRACKGGEPACSNFNISGPFTEWILLGVLALRFPGKLEWDSAKMRVTNVPEANHMLRPKFRKGWTLG